MHPIYSSTNGDTPRAPPPEKEGEARSTSGVRNFAMVSYIYQWISISSPRPGRISRGVNGASVDTTHDRRSSVVLLACCTAVWIHHVEHFLAH